MMERSRRSKILEDTTGLSTEELETCYEEWVKSQTVAMEDGSYMMVGGNFVLEPKEGLAYDTFLTDMHKVCEILGPGSGFTEEGIRQNAMVEMTYEDALEEYNNLLEKDGLTGGYARLFCDYMGIILAVLPVFVAVTREIRDKRAQMKELLYV